MQNIVMAAVEFSLGNTKLNVKVYGPLREPTKGTLGADFALVADK